MQPQIKVSGLSKRYTLGGATTATTLREWIGDSLKHVAGRRPKAETPRVLLALDDVSFSVGQGEVLGVIGHNGAGKSTLLKVLSRITEPTTGRVEIKGRVASLLEVGTGFHPELTGRENVFLNGAVLGMSRAEIRSKFSDIVSFAEVEQFLDTPVKRYSSGMYVRLAFAVAAHLEPELLIVDEVLAVGDFEFQNKCLGKMQDVARSGRTVLFVSHNMQAVSTLTQRAILLADGRIASTGATQEVIAEYLRSGAPEGLVYSAPASADGPRLTYAEVVTSEPNNVHMNGDPLELRFRIETPKPLEKAAI